MPAQVRGMSRHHHDMPGPRQDELLTTRAHVGLPRLEGVDPADFGRLGYRGISAHSSNPATIATATATMT